LTSAATWLRVAPLVAAIAVTSATAYAQDDGESTRRYGQYFNGAFVEVSSRAALSHVTSSSYNGWSWDVGLRQALVMHLLDTRLSYAEDRFAPRDGAEGGEFVMRSLGITTGFHPLYMALLLSDWFGYVLASWYVEAGIAAQYATTPDGQADPGVRWSVGTGLDVPITDPDVGWSIWLNAVYRFVWSDFDFDAGGEVDLYHHAGWAGLSVRFNGLLF
jgi:hypothetical protein